MRDKKVAIIDYGVGNLLSVQRAIEHCGALALCTSDPETIIQADRVILPGVGAFGKAMQALEQKDLHRAIHNVVGNGTPLLGICLGMQLLFQDGEEFGHHKGLAILEGKVEAIPSKTPDGVRLKIPHIGWNGLSRPVNVEWKGTILEGLQEEDSFYFVHSYRVLPTQESIMISDCSYGGLRLAAVVASGSVMGCQFHPEKSGRAGLRILENFIKLGD